MPAWAAMTLCLLLGALVGAAWSLLPALLRAYQGVNEIITTLMMTFLGVSLANVLVKLVFLDPATTVPQTRTLPVADRLPKLFGTRISGGLVIGLVAVIAVHLLMTRTAFGLKLRVVSKSIRWEDRSSRGRSFRFSFSRRFSQSCCRRARSGGASTPSAATLTSRAMRAFASAAYGWRCSPQAA